MSAFWDDFRAALRATWEPFRDVTPRGVWRALRGMWASFLEEWR